MSNIAEVQSEVNKLIVKMLAKGLVKPEAEFVVRANTESLVRLSWLKEGVVPDWDRTYSYHVGVFIDALSKAEAAITAIPDKTEREKSAFLAKLDEVIAFGRETGIEVDFVNPLVETMKRLSENIITHQRAAR